MSAKSSLLENFITYTGVTAGHDTLRHQNSSVFAQFFIIFLNEIRTYSCVCFGVAIAFENT